MKAKDFFSLFLVSAIITGSSRNKAPSRADTIITVISYIVGAIGVAWICAMCTACRGDDYHYPSVKLEYLTATTDTSGALSAVLTDDGELWEVMKDGSGLSSTADSTLRVVGYYEYLTADGEVTDATAGAIAGVRLYACSEAIAPLPKLPEDFEDGVVSKPAAVRSIWMGLDYLNVVMTATQTGTHAVAFVQQDLTTDADGQPELTLLLYHDVDSDVVSYTRTAYLSVPLAQYAADGATQVTVHFTLYTDEDTLSTYTFVYTP